VRSIDYLRRYANIKKYGNKYKLTVFNCMTSKGGGGCRGINDHKLSCNISRTKARIFELAMCNRWDYFITCTLDKDKYDRTNLKKFQKDLSQFIRHQRQKYKADIKYLLIPELHSDMISWHMHGLVKGISKDMIAEFDPDKHPIDLIFKGYKNWPDYEKKFGYVSLGKIQSEEAVAKYITKYITKDVEKNVSEVGSRMFYSSIGLKGSELIKEGTLHTHPNSKYDYKNDYVSIVWLSEQEVKMCLLGFE